MISVLSRIDSQGSPSRPAASAASKKVTLMDEMQSYLALARTTGTQTDYRESEAQVCFDFCLHVCLFVFLLSFYKSLISSLFCRPFIVYIYNFSS